MRHTLAIKRQEQFRLDGRHVLALLVAFFGTVFAVNGYFLVSALSTHTGVVSVEPYRKGLAYNERIAAGERQSALGWRDEIAADREGELSILVLGPDGRGVSGLHIAGTIGRPSTASHDRKLVLVEKSDGKHTGQVGRLEAGSWLVVIEARRSPDDAEPIYRARRRLWLKS